jgi:hypothetical protein
MKAGQCLQCGPGVGRSSATGRAASLATVLVKRPQPLGVHVEVERVDRREVDPAGAEVGDCDRHLVEPEDARDSQRLRHQLAVLLRVALRGEQLVVADQRASGCSVLGERQQVERHPDHQRAARRGVAALHDVRVDARRVGRDVVGDDDLSVPRRQVAQQRGQARGEFVDVAGVHLGLGLGVQRVAHRGVLVAVGPVARHHRARRARQVSSHFAACQFAPLHSAHRTNPLVGREQSTQTPAAFWASYFRLSSARRQILHDRCEPLNRVFTSSKVCPLSHSVLTTFAAVMPTPRSTFVLGVTASRWAGLTHDRTRQRWSMCNPAGIGSIASYARR